MNLVIAFLNFVVIYGAYLKDFPSNNQELDAKYWEKLANGEILNSYHRKHIHAKAKNVILFVGGGMGLPTITASRILKGQLQGRSGEEEKLSFENFPNTCLLKTYSVDQQVPDTAATSTALLSGVKTNNGVQGVSARVKKGVSSCETVQNSIITSIFDLAYDEARITEGCAASAYSSIADEDWEFKIPLKYAQHPTHEDCKDKARQLIENHPGKNLNVILGGGSGSLYPNNYINPGSGKPGHREDGINLIDLWLNQKKEMGLLSNQYKFVNKRDDLLKATDPNIDYLFGIFNEDILNYDKEQKHFEPTVAEMTEAAITILKKNKNGFLLLVENGQIDISHHENHANLALFQTLFLENAVEKAMKMVSIEDTLIAVTADHSQALTINGHQPRGHSIMGIAGKDDESNKPYTTLMYSTGPGYKKNRTDPSLVDTSALRYQSHSAIYLESSHHTGEDVALYSIGPMSHLFHGTREQSYVAHALSFAACIGHYVHYDHCTN